MLVVVDNDSDDEGSSPDPPAAKKRHNKRHRGRGRDVTHALLKELLQQHSKKVG